MNWKAKIALGLAVVLLASAAVTGVAFLTTQQQAPVADQGLYVGGEKVEDPGVMMIVGGQEIGFAEYRYYYMMNKSYAEQIYGGDVWKGDYDGSKAIQLRKMTEDSIVQIEAWKKLASEKGVSLSEEDKQEIIDTMNEQKSTLGEAGFEKNLRDMFFESEEQYLQITETQALVKKVQEQLKEEYIAEVEANLDDFFVTAKHILIGPDGISETEPTAEEALLDEVGSLADSQPVESQVNGGEDQAVDSQTEDSQAASSEAAPEMTDEEKDQAAKEFAQGLLDQLRAAEAQGLDTATLFDELMQQYGMDPGVAESPDGYTFGEGQMVEAFYEGAMALEPGQISELIPTDFGYHIIMRLPLNQEALGNGDKEAAIDQEASAKMNAEFATVKDGLQVEYGAYYTEVTPDGMR